MNQMFILRKVVRTGHLQSKMFITLEVSQYYWQRFDRVLFKKYGVSAEELSADSCPAEI